MNRRRFKTDAICIVFVRPVVLHPSQFISPIPPPIVDQVACYNSVLTVSCPPTAVLTFETARYGRNDTQLASRCGVPFTRHCDVDVHFLLNRACAGRRKCSMVVGASTFGDPCGYEEFLRVEYRCVPGTERLLSCRVNMRASAVWRTRGVGGGRGEGALFHADGEGGLRHRGRGQTVGSWR